MTRQLLFGLCIILFCSPSSAAEKKVRLFILSGQSNMAGLNPNLSFTPAVTKAFSEDEVIVVKDAQGGQPIRRWYKQWKAPEGAKVARANRQNGTLYDRLMTKVNKAIEGKKLTSICFVWMQGERDAKESLSAVYAASMKGLIQQLRTDLKREDISFVIGRLSDCLKGKEHWDAVRQAQIEVAKSDPIGEWVDTDDLNGPKDGLHYNKEGYVKLGERFAEKAIALSKKE